MLNMQLLPYLCGFFPCFAFVLLNIGKKKGITAVVGILF